ncbi:VCBS domain-containing protein [Bradyrhizobium sp. 172]|uniref:VCBS domain-containing protein n=1 Tax=Bradyrhizobium sp. 172 TaxID=2782643 RepID=UPI00200034C9|nr:VCBS domain-containing protein [Bradyrhizobium sp. 172]UPJ94240.1 VCBS domain-containing protein [Bradyrhizobium sp. 172]
MATQATGGGSTVSFGNTPQANTDIFSFAEDASNILILNVLANDLGGAAKTLFSLDDGTSTSASTKNYAPADLLVKDLAYSSDAAGMVGTGDRSALGARIWIESDGTVHYDKGDINTQLQALAAGQTLTDTFTYAIQLGNGTLSWATVTLQFNGANDSVSITSSPQSGSVVEDANITPYPSDSQSAAGTISFNDADLSDTHSATFAAAASNTTALGTFSLDPVGEAPNAANGSVQWHYALNNSAAQYLAAGQSVTESFVVTVNDGHGSTATQTVTVTTTGTNDNAVITVGAGNSASGAVTEDAHPTSETASGMLSFSDVDLSDTHSVTSVTPSAGALGMLTASVTTDDSHSTGTGGVITWNYSVADSAVQYLAQGQTKTETFAVHLFDGTSTVDKIVTVTITGTNDAPVITSSAQAGSVQEDTTLTATGQVTSSDVDHGATAAYSGGATGTYGSFAVNAATGVWTYTLDNATHQDLAAGESHTETFTVTVTDDKGATATQDVVITITGTNDAPVITSSAQAGSVQEDTTLTATGQVTSSDVDHGATAAYSGGATGTYGSFAVNAATGVWTYTLDNATHQDLAAGESHTETFTVTVTDDKGATATQDVVITITGTNDAPVITSSAQAGSVQEDTTLTATGQVTSSDVDHGATAAYSGGATGTYGSFAVNAATGVWTYTLDNATHQDLAAGESHTETFTVTVTDDKGATATQDVVITITGTNDAPVITSSAQAGSVQEDTTLTATGQVTSSDVDHGATAAYSGGATGTYGSFAVNAATGVWTYTLDNATHQDLAAGESHTETFTVTVTDDKGATATQDVVITITGTNDAPVITSSAQAGSVQEDTTLTATGQVTSSDVDHGATAAYSGGATGTYGSFAVNAATGVWTYTLDNATHQDLAAGESHTETFTVTVTDDKGATATQDVVITITGTNDAPVITSSAQAGSVQEDTTLTATGQVTSSDVDHGATAAYSGGATGTYGSFAVNAATGVWTYTLDNATHQDLAAGESHTETFTVTVTDDKGATATQDVVITITGTNDAPVITSSAQAGSVQEDTTLTATGQVTSSDVDHGATAAYSGGATGTYGSFAVNAATGVWTYTLDNATHQDLAAGESHTETFTVTVTDDKGATATQDVVITITGTNDAPVITSSAQAGSVQEDTTLTATGQVTSSDVDHGATAAYSGGATGTYGSFAVNAATGVWTYTLDNATHQDLAAGESHTETFTVTVTDDKGATATQDVVITITGTNDAPVITSSAQAGSVQEDTTLTATGQVTSSDVDHGATAAYSGGATGTYGSFAVNAATGVWTYTLDNATHQDLAAGESHTETFTVTVTDDKGATATQDVVITITGTNDAPVITSSAQAGSVQEDTTLTATGQVTSSDVDHGATAAYSGGATGTYGSFAVNAATGVWTYTLDNATHQDLAAGESHTETFTVTVTDDKGATATQDVVITITGTNDAPVITSSAQAGSVQEDTTLTATGQVTSSDVDHGATAAYSGGATGTYGSFAVNAATGVWTYTLDNATHQDLAAGESHTETFTVTVTDDKGATATQDVVITITGTNDAPVITSSAQAGSVQEDTTLTATGQVTSSDVDHGATAAYSGGATGTYGSFAVNAATGVWTYTLDNATHQDLAAGESHTETFTVTVTDDKGATATQDVVITITGTNDAPVITSSAQAGSVQEDTTLTATGQVTSSDVDHGATAAYSGGATGTYGSFAVNAATGVWTYTLDNATHQDLAAGESHTETFTVTVTDDKGATATQDVVITITGTNDAPVITSSAQAGSVQEDTTLTATGQVTSSDVDHGATAAYSGGATGTYGSFAVNAATGVWTYTLDNATHQDLAAGESHTETFTVTVTDDKGATATQDVVITITGTNDAPVITSSAQAGSVQEDTTLTATGQVTSSDVDHGATAAYSGGATGTYGSFAVNAATGVWTYTLDNATHQDLAAGESHTETFTVTVTDDKGATATQDVVITITGTNDAPVITSSAQAGSVQEDTTLTATGQVTSSDVDHGATAAYSGGATGTYGSFAVNAATGVWTYTLDNATHQDLAAGESHTETFTVTVTDDKGATATQDVVITITGTNDAPVITSSAQAGSVQEDTTLTATGQVTSSDVDHGATAAYSGGATGTYGSFAVNAATGVWTYTLDNATHQDLAAGESHTETFTVTVTDDKGATATQDVVITITGTNDAPVITSSAQAGSVQEDTTLTATGQVTSSDVDHGATAAYSGGATGTYGSFAVNAATGVWTYTLDNATHQDLAAGESHTETFTVTVTDDKGATATQDVVITITGTNDAPVITSSAQAGSVQEDTTLTATGQVTSSDVDHGATAAYSGGATGTYGSFAVNAATGVWTYTLDNATHQDLAAGESHTETFTVTVTDDKGATATQDVVITITGTNDAPVITSSAQAGSVQEDTTLTATGQVTSSDVDHGATAAYSGGATGTYGSFAVNAATGVWTYTLDNATHQDLAAGESHTETFTVTVTDDKGATATQDVVITITGTNDAPVITSSAQAGSVQEDTTLTATGQVTSSDVDHGATAAYSGGATGTYGSFAVNAATGVWTYTLDNATHQDLAAGESHTETFTVTVTDDKGATATQDVVITITGTNDAPVITSSAQAGSVQEDTTLTATGQVTSSDVDHGATAAYSGGATGTYGSFAVNAATGVWTYTLDNATHQDLAAGESHTETFTVTVTDDKGATATQDVVITITGTNDAPVITSSAQAGSVQEDTTLTATGQVTSSDVDHGATAAYSGGATGTYGSFAVNAATGVWTYTLDNATHQDLAAGESHTETFTVTVTDDKGATATQDVVITITGTNDAPVITSSAQAGSVQEDTTLTATGQVTSSDVDHGATAAYSGGATGTYGSFAVNAATGVWTYTLDNATHQDLAAGESHTETFTVTVTDDKGATATQDVVITITGTNDAPVITSSAQAGSVQEDTTLTATGQVTSSDVDHGATAAYSGGATGTYGSFAVNAATGVWTYTLDNATHQDLAAGESHTETFTVTVTDDKGATATQDVVITITGTNDAPVITSSAQAGSVQEDTTLTATGQVTSSDVDHGATAAYSGGATGTYGSFAVNAATGVWTYTLDNATHQDLAAGESHTETFTVTVTDDKGATATQDVVITITGTNDAPVITSSAQAGSVQEDTTLTATGQVTSSDVDHGATAAYSGGATGTYGSFAVNAATGVWTYTLDNATHQDLAAGESHTETFTVTVTDDKGATATQDVVITITGTNDAPVITSSAQAGSVQEDTTLTATGQVTSSDVDHGATAAYSGGATGTYGSFAVNAATGVWTYTLDNATHQDLAAGESHTETFTVTVTDDKGATATQDVVITITGTNDAPVITSSAQAGSVQEDTTLTATGQVTSSDVDHGATAAYSGGATGTYGSFAVNAATGVWTYTLDNATHQDLAAGESHTETFTVTVTDDKGATATQDVVITITGTNDAPVITSSAQAGSVQEDTTLTATGQVTSSDVDHGATAAYSGGATGTYGSFAVNAATGVWTYTLDNATHQDLAAGESHTETFTVTVTDDKGATATQDVVITITGTNDAPVITSSAQAGSVQEDTTLTATGQVTSSDVDHGATAAYSGGATGTYGSFAVNAATGVWTYTLDNATHQDLAAGESHTETFTVTVTDDKGATATQDVVITITGTNDAPVIVAGHTLNYTENQAATAIDPALTVSDVDNANLASATVQITGNYVNGQDVLGFTNQNGITGSFNAATGTLTLTGSSSVANYQTALDSVTYFNTSDNPSGLARTVTIITNDGAANSVAVTDTINVTPVNDAPVVVAGHTLNYTENQAATAIDGAITVSDVDSANLASATVQITGNYVNGQDVLGFTNQNGIAGSFNAATGMLTLTGSSSVANYQTALDSVTYFNSSDNPSGAIRTISYQVDDGQAANHASNVVTSTVSVTAVNDGPTNTMPASYTSNEDTSVKLSGLSVTDIDSGANNITVTLAVASGTITAATAGSVTVTGSGTGSIVLTGTVANINTYLATVANQPTYVPVANANGAISLTMTTSDQGFTGTGGTLTDTDSININITAVNDGPTNTLPASYTTNEDTSVKLSGLSVTDIDSGANNISVTLAVASGTITAATAGSVTVTGSGTGSIVLTGTVANINTYLATVANQPTYVPVANANGAVSLTMTTSDQGFTGTGGTLTDTDSININITAVNDAPVNTVPGTQEVLHDANLSITGMSISDVDAGGAVNITTNLSVLHGTLTIASAGGALVSGSGTGSVTLTGTVAQINTTLAAANNVVYKGVANFVGSDTLTVLTNDHGNTGTGGNLTDTDAVTINVESNNPGTLTTSPTDVIFYASGTNTLNGTNATLNGTDSITGGTGTDTLILTGGSPLATFGAGNIVLTNFEVFKIVDSNSGNHTNNITFLSGFQNNGTLTVDGSGIGGNGKLNLQASTVTSGAFVVIGGDNDDIINTGSGDDTITGGPGNDTLTGGGGNDTFNVNSGTDTVTDLSGSDVLVVSAGATTNATVSAAFTATSSTSNAGTANLSSNGFAVDLSAATGANGFTVTNTGAAAAITGSAQNDTLIGGSGNDTLVGGSGADSITGGAGADTMTGGGGIDTFIINSTQSLGIVGGSGDVGTISGYDVITDFATASDILNLQGTPAAASNTTGVNGTDSALTIGGNKVSSHAITNGIITFDDTGTYATALSLTSTANVAAVVDYLNRNDIGTTGTTVAFIATIGGTAHTYIYEQLSTGTPVSSSDYLLVDLQNVTLTSGGTSLSSLIPTHVAPAGIAGEAINLGLTNPTEFVGSITVSIAGVPAGWTLSEGIDNGDGAWTVQTNDLSSLNVTAPSGYVGATALHLTETWTNVGGSAGRAFFTDNVEVYAQGSPIFALSGDDNLTGSSGHDMFVFSQPIGHDVIYSFDAASDQIDLIGYADLTGFGDIQSHMVNDANGNAMITLADGQSITLNGVDASSLTASDFIFDQTPVTENAGHMVISDGAILPLSGTIDNIGTIELNSTGSETDLELIEHGITLQGHGQVILSDDSENVITGTVSDVTLTNVDNTISGAGHLGDGVMVLVNEGTIIATGTNALDIDTGSNAVTNPGTLEATGTGGLEVHSDLINTGVLWANGGNVTIDGNVSGNGTAQISGSATLEFGAASSANVALDAQATGTIVLHDSFDFSGVVSGFNGDDHLDLLDVAFGAGTTASYVANQAGAGGTLSVTDGVHTANINLLGQYDPAGFQTEADKNTGTLISYHDHLA